MRRIRWERVNDSAAIGYEHLGHPYKDRALVWVSLTEPQMFGGIMAAIDRVLGAYGTMNPELRAALDSTPETDPDRAEIVERYFGDAEPESSAPECPHDLQAGEACHMCAVAAPAGVQPPWCSRCGGTVCQLGACCRLRDTAGEREPAPPRIEERFLRPALSPIVNDAFKRARAAMDASGVVRLPDAEPFVSAIIATYNQFLAVLAAPAPVAPEQNEVRSCPIEGCQKQFAHNGECGPVYDVVAGRPGESLAAMYADDYAHEFEQPDAGRQSTAAAEPLCIHDSLESECPMCGAEALLKV